MVATRLLEVTNKGTEWAYGSEPGSESLNENKTLPPGNISPQEDSYSSWLLSSANHYWDKTKDYATESVSGLASSVYSKDPWLLSGGDSPSNARVERRNSFEQYIGDVPLLRRLSLHSSPISVSPKHMFAYNRNPYLLVRNSQVQLEQGTSMSAIRSLLKLVPMEESKRLETVQEEAPLIEEIEDMETDEANIKNKWGRQDSFSTTGTGTSLTRKSLSSSETASQLAEGTIRALRDIALSQAVELHSALRFWSSRWERPLLSWLEAGPVVWASKNGYDHQLIGRKVSQIQASLARRCSAIGELQHHLLRAGWHKGVAQWGVLGQGGQWAAVGGADLQNKTAEDSETDLSDSEKGLVSPLVSPSSSRIGLQEHGHGPAPDTNCTANIFVQNEKGGGIFVDDPAFLARWSIGAMALVRNVLKRVSSGFITIPYETNWATSAPRDEVENEMLPPEENTSSLLPIWARKQATGDSIGVGIHCQEELVISDLPLMAAEVSELLNVMGNIFEMEERRRRLEMMKPPNRLRRNWYVVVTAIPAASFLVFWMIRKGYTVNLFKLIAQRIALMVRERVIIPVTEIINEMWEGREPFSDRKARDETIAILKKMIKSWLDDKYPLMTESERKEMAETMDVSLIERDKEESMKTFYEINNVIRMSFIEMQYMKKEMMNALSAMDQVVSANDISTNLAAITPMLLFAYMNKRVFRFLYYLLLKPGKSRQETYTRFRNILTDIERLLVMRDNPPGLNANSDFPVQQTLTNNEPCVLGPDDLGMLTLLVHECRTILWRDRRRFSHDTIRSISEDLAALVGERGAVSIRQQIQIIERMNRTYPFLKVKSTGIMI